MFHYVGIICGGFLRVPFLFQTGDPTLSVLELWGAEYQESNALLLRPNDRKFLEQVCQREKCPVDFVGKITGDGKVWFKEAKCIWILDTVIIGLPFPNL